MDLREKQFEEEKREKAWDPRQRWEVLQRTIGWVDAEQPVPRNSPRGCLTSKGLKSTNRGHPKIRITELPDGKEQ
jgi:hypothetical protein